MKNITKKAIAQEIAKKHGLDPKLVQLTINILFECLTESLANNDRCEFRDFGIFETVIRKPKIGRNPKKADVPIIIPAKRVVKFSPSKNMKNRVLQ